MQIKILIIAGILSLAMSCKAQTTYSQKVLEEQSNQINYLQTKTKKENKSVLKVNDIVKQVKVPIISCSINSSSEDFDHVKLLILHFYKDKEFDYKMDNKIKFYDIYLYIKKPLLYNEAAKVTRASQGKWTKEVADYFGDLEVESVNAK